MSNADRRHDPDDLFADTRMSFGEHIEELRTHLLRAVAGFLVALVLSFSFGSYVLEFIKAPVERELMEFYNRRYQKREAELASGKDTEHKELNQPKAVPIQVQKNELARILGLKVPDPAPGEENGEEWVSLPVRVRPLDLALATGDAQRLLIGKPPLLSTMGIMEAFMALVKVCILCGIVLGSPWIFYQLWAFVAAGLYTHEKRYVNVYLPVSLGLFLIGVFFCEFLVIPKAISTLLLFNEWLGFEPDLRINEWLTFAILFPLVFGLSFQTPLVMLFLSKIGIFDADSYRRKRRIAWFAMAAFAAVITPIDAISMVLLWVPMCGLYELGILLVAYTAKATEGEEDVPEAEEMVEV
jgi:sec-independent protein translocase protein TatC